MCLTQPLIETCMAPTRDMPTVVNKRTTINVYGTIKHTATALHAEKAALMFARLVKWYFMLYI